MFPRLLIPDDDYAKNNCLIILDQKCDQKYDKYNLASEILALLFITTLNEYIVTFKYKYQGI